MRAPLSYIPLLPILAAIIAGILIAQLNIPILWVILPIAIGIFLYIFRNDGGAIILLAFSLGFINASINLPEQLPTSPQQKQLYEGEIISVDERESSTALLVKTDAASGTSTKSIKCIVSIPATSLGIYPYDKVSFYTTLKPPCNDNSPDAFDYAVYLYRNGISATAFAQPEDIAITGHRHSLFEQILDFRYKATEYLLLSSLSENTAYFLNATIIGDDSNITQEQRMEYSTAGIAHILALSGLHVGIISIVISILLFPLYLTRKRNIGMIITIALLWLYAIMTGLSPSVTRAVIMATLYFGSLLLQRHHSSLNAVCFAAIAILIFNPLELYDAGFQLSFVAVISILLFAERLNPVNRHRHHISYSIVSIFTVSLAAMLGVGIVSAYYFHNFPLYFLLGNVFSSIILPPLIGGGVLLILLQSLAIPSDWLCTILDMLYLGLDFITTHINNLPGANINKIYFPAWVMIPYFGAVTAGLIALIKRRRVYIAGAVILFAATLILSILLKPTYPTHEFFIPQDTYFTNIIYRDEKSAYLITTAPPQDAKSMLYRCQYRHRDFLGRRSCENLYLIGDSITLPHLLKCGQLLSIGNTDIVIISDNKSLPTVKRTDYVLVCRGFKGSIYQLSNHISADTILLSNDLHPRRHARYAEECTRLNIPYRSLKEPNIFHITQP